MKKEMVARELVVIARLLAAAEPEGEDAELEVEDEGFTQKLRDLRSGLLKISRKKNMRLNKFGIGMIRPQAKVTDLVDALLKISAAST
jgi:hypothetical protein